MFLGRRENPESAKVAEPSGAPWSEGERSEPERNGAPDGSKSIGGGLAIPDPEVPEVPPRRQFTAEYKERIVREAEKCTEPGQIGALLRREGLYSSQLSAWRKKYRKGIRKALQAQKRGRKQTKDPLKIECEKLRRQNKALQKRLEQAEAIIEIQKKVSAMLTKMSQEDEGNDKSEC